MGQWVSKNCLTVLLFHCLTVLLSSCTSGVIPYGGGERGTAMRWIPRKKFQRINRVWKMTVLLRTSYTIVRERSPVTDKCVLLWKLNQTNLRVVEPVMTFRLLAYNIISVLSRGKIKLVCQNQ